MDPTLPPSLPVIDLNPTPDLSPTLDLLPPEQRPNPMPACGRCQMAMWFLAESSLSCYCKSMQRVVWDGSKPPVRRCDGQLLPVAREQRVSAT